MARRLTAKERRELPARAFGIPSQRKYPVMVLNRSGEPVPSKGHAVDAKGRAMEELEKGRIDRRQYNQIVRKADTAIREVERAKKKAKRKPAKKKKVTKRKATKKKATRRRGAKSLTGAQQKKLREQVWKWAQKNMDKVPSSSQMTTRKASSLLNSLAKSVPKVKTAPYGMGWMIAGEYFRDENLRGLVTPAFERAEKGRQSDLKKTRKNPSLTGKEKSLLFNVVKAGTYPKRAAHKKFGKATADSLIESGLIESAVDVYTPGSEGFAAVSEFAPMSTPEEEEWESVVDESATTYQEPRGYSPLRAGSRRKNPTEHDHEVTGLEALKNSHEYWEGYQRTGRTNLLVDAYKFLVIAHEELKYSGQSEPRLQADHMLKAAHKELSKKLRG